MTDAGCVHRTVVCLGCGEIWVRCACDGTAPHQWCGRREEPSAEPPAEPATGTGRRTTKRTARLSPLESTAAMIFTMEDPGQVADWLEALAQIVRRTNRLRLSGSALGGLPEDPE